METHDIDNLKFLLGTSEEVFEDWLQQTDEDDIIYAIEIIQRAKVLMEMRIVSILDKVEDTSISEKILKGIIYENRSR
jgi:hypothetical protein